MLCSILIVKIVICAILAAEVPQPQKEFSVAFSQQQPFVYRNQYNTLMGLDVFIINSFAKKFHFQIKYIEFNTSLNEMFNKEEPMENDLLGEYLQ